MQTSKQKGFTLIELLVVIVIIGILATISVATFSGYFAKARDSEKQAAIRNSATLMKTARAVETITTFVQTQAEVVSTLNDEGGYALPGTPAVGEYYYIHEDTGNEFAMMVCSEETEGAVFVDGTSALVATVNAAAAVICVSPPIAPTDAILDTALPAGNYTVVDMNA